MGSASGHHVYSPREIALAAGVAEDDVLAAVGYARELVPHGEAVQTRLQRVAQGMAFACLRHRTWAGVGLWTN